MAKLSAGGRTELYRVAQLKPTNDPEASTEWSKMTHAVMSDGKVLEKLDIRYKKDLYREAYNHSYGWKVRGKLKPGVTPEQWLEGKLKLGYERVTK